MMLLGILLLQGSENKMQKKMHILITDYHCASNRGDAAILEGIIHSLGDYLPDPEFTVLTGYPESAEIINQVNSVKQKMVPFRWVDIKKNIASLYLLIGAFFYKRGIDLPGMKMLIKRLSLETYLDADLIVSTGGGFLNDFYTPGNLGRFWGLYFAKVLGKPVAIYAQSIGPLNKPFYRWIARYVLNKVDLITLRDRESKEVLDLLGVIKPPIYVVTDAAFNIDLHNEKTLQSKRLESNLIDSNNRLKVSVSVRKWAYYERENGHEEYINAMAKLIDWLILEQKAQVIFASTCTGFAGYPNDDRVIAHEVISHMGHAVKRNPAILYGEYTPQELSHFYGMMDLHIGTRMHSNILAMLSGTPVVAIQYEFKTKGLMELFALEDYILNINDITEDSLICLVKKALEQKSYIKDQINNNLPGIKKESRKPAKLIKEIICDGGILRT